VKKNSKEKYAFIFLKEDLGESQENTEEKFGLRQPDNFKF
jgi:hypothetical protein